MNSAFWNFTDNPQGSSGSLNLSVAGPSNVNNYEQFSGRHDPNILSPTLPGQRSSANNFVSPRGLFKVTNLLSLDGAEGWPIRASVTFTYQTNEVIFLRLVLGKKAITTSVTQLAGREHGVWQLDAVSPPLNEVAQYTDIGVPIVVQALRSSGDVLDSLLIGSFIYRHGLTSVYQSQDSLPRPYNSDSPSITRSSNFTDSSIVGSISRPPSSSPRPSSSRSKPAKSIRGVGRKKQQILMRTRRSEPGEELGQSHRVIFELLTPLDTVCANWSAEEIKTGRRLIRFTSRIEGARLRVSCERINQEEYSEGDAVVSCIYRRDNTSCYFTSVDIICLLERLVGEDFEIEEKNRIRRNLEGFHPQTVSKNRKDSEDFFQQIMDFPSPKPRHIEKDVKVFDWAILGRALEKIISKYDSTPSPPSRYSQRHPSPSSDLSVAAMVPSHPQTGSYHSGISSHSPSPFFALGHQYPTDPGLGYFRHGSGSHSTQMSLHHHPDPANWFSTIDTPHPRLSPSLSDTSSSASDLSSSYHDPWAEDTSRPAPFPIPTFLPESAMVRS